VRADAFAEERESQPVQAAVDDRAKLAERIDELMQAGLVSAEMDDDGAISYALTGAGRKVARQMAMHRDGHALVLLGALVSSEEGLN
jgi:hypothetical protein